MLGLIRKDVAVMTKSHFPVTFMVLPCLDSGEWSEFLHLKGMRIRGNGKESDQHNLGIGEAAVWEGTKKTESLLAEDTAEGGIWWWPSLEKVLGVTAGQLLITPHNTRTAGHTLKPAEDLLKAQKGKNFLCGASQSFGKVARGDCETGHEQHPEGTWTFLFCVLVLGDCVRNESQIVSGLVCSLKIASLTVTGGIDGWQI